MEFSQEILSWLSSDNGSAVHLAVFILLLLGSIGFPIPEDLPIILAGIAASKNITSFQSIFLTCYLGVIIADTILYFIGHFFGRKILSVGVKSTFLPYLTQERVDQTRESLRKNRLYYIIVGRHFFPVRTVTFLTAGALHIPFVEFILADGVAALFSVAIVLSIGFFLGERITPEVLSHLVNKASYYIVGILILVLILLFIRKKKKAANE